MNYQTRRKFIHHSDSLELEMCVCLSFQEFTTKRNLKGHMNAR